MEADVHGLKAWGLSLRGRNQRLGALGLAASIEFVALGGVFWSPLAAAILSAVMQQSNDEKRQMIKEEVDRAVVIARNEAKKRIPVTPAEPSLWLGMGMGSAWEQFFAAMVIHDNLSIWQEKVQFAAPPGWTLELVSVSLGKEGPTFSGWQCLSSPQGSLVAAECKMEMISDSIRVVVKGNGPLGEFQANVSSLSVLGQMKLISIPDQRMILWSFKQPPDVSFKLQLSSGQSDAYDVPSFSFLRNALADSIKGSLVEPRRAAISLDYDYTTPMQAIDTTVTVYIESVQNLFSSRKVTAGRSASVPSSREDAATGNLYDDTSPAVQSATRLIQMVASNVETKLKRRTHTKQVSASSRSPSSINSVLKLSLGGKEGIIQIDILDCSKDSRPILGSCLIHTAATKDGKTLFWAAGKDDEPMALRWQPSLGPWRLTLPLEGSSSPKAAITIQLSAEPWLYKSSSLPNGVSDGRPSRTPGQRSIVLQILEARDLSPRTWGGSTAPFCNPYAILKYDSRTLRTATLFNTSQPVWNRIFVLSENPSQLGRQVQLELWDSRAGSMDESLGSVAMNLDLAAENSIIDRWVQLAGEESGEVRVRITAVPGVPSSPQVQSLLDVFESTLLKSSTPSLRVMVLMARNLPMSETKEGHFVNVLYHSTRQSSFARRGSSPTFNFTSLFPFQWDDIEDVRSSLDKDEEKALRIEVKDADSLDPDDLIGHCSLDVGSLTPEIGMSWEEWVPLRGTQNGAEVLVRVSHLEPSPVISGIPTPPTSATAPHDTSDTKPRQDMDPIDERDVDSRKRLSPGSLIASGASQLLQGLTIGLNRQFEVTKEAGGELRSKLAKEWAPRASEWWKSTPVSKSKASEEDGEISQPVLPVAKEGVGKEVATKKGDEKILPAPEAKQSLFGFSLAWPNVWSSTNASPPPILPSLLTVPLELLSAEQIAKIREQVPDLLKDVIKGGQSMTGKGLAKLDLSTLSQSSRSFVLSVLPLSVLNYQGGKADKALDKVPLILASHPLDGMEEEKEDEEEGEVGEEEVLAGVEAAATAEVEDPEAKEPAAGVKKAEFEMSLDWGIPRNALSSFEDVVPKQ